MFLSPVPAVPLLPGADPPAHPRGRNTVQVRYNLQKNHLFRASVSRIIRSLEDRFPVEKAGSEGA